MQSLKHLRYLRCLVTHHVIIRVCKCLIVLLQIRLSFVAVFQQYTDDCSFAFLEGLFTPFVYISKLKQLKLNFLLEYVGDTLGCPQIYQALVLVTCELSFLLVICVKLRFTPFVYISKLKELELHILLGCVGDTLECPQSQQAFALDSYK